jgi:hypothetical protein
MAYPKNYWRPSIAQSCFESSQWNSPTSIKPLTASGKRFTIPARRRLLPKASTKLGDFPDHGPGKIGMAGKHRPVNKSHDNLRLPLGAPHQGAKLDPLKMIRIGDD